MSTQISSSTVPGPGVRHIRRGAPTPANALARIEFGTAARSGDDPREVRIAVDVFGDAGPVELWLSDRPVDVGRAQDINFAHDGEVLFASLRIDESQLSDVEAAIASAYARMNAFLERSGFPHPLRVWNFLSRINEGEGDLERYRLFNAGRHSVVTHRPDYARQLPAASAIGTRNDGFTLYLFAGKRPGLQIENPRQVSAYLYPREHGPKSPLFSRAILLCEGGSARLLVSGTASIVGHRSVHLGDPLAQLEETASNIRVLLDQAITDGLPRGAAAHPRAESIKLYVRDPALIPALQPHAARLLGRDGAPVLFVHGDICRRELLLEAEGVYFLDGAPTASPR